MGTPSLSKRNSRVHQCQPGSFPGTCVGGSVVPPANSRSPRKNPVRLSPGRNGKPGLSRFDNGKDPSSRDGFSSPSGGFSASDPRSGASLDAFTETSGHRALSVYCQRCGDKRRVVLRCGHRSCEECRRKDYRRLLRGYLEAVRNFRNPKLVTLTVRNVDTLDRERVAKTVANFKALMHQKYYRNRVRGGLRVVEIVNKGRGWNVHLHVLIDALYLEQPRLSRDWLELTGDSFVVDVRRVGSPKEGLRYVLKYLAKAPALSGNESTYDRVMKGARFVQPFGVLYDALGIERFPSVCPSCEQTAWLSSYDLSRLERYALGAPGPCFYVNPRDGPGSNGGFSLIKTYPGHLKGAVLGKGKRALGAPGLLILPGLGVEWQDETQNEMG